MGGEGVESNSETDTKVCIGDACIADSGGPDGTGAGTPGTIEVSIVGGLLIAEDAGVVETMMVVGDVVTAVRVRVCVRVTGLVITDDAEVIVV